MPKVYEMVISKVIQETPDVRTFRYQWPNGTDIDFKAGQFITVHFLDDPKTRRAYSLSSCALDRGFFDITVKRAGNFGTRFYDNAKEGMKMAVFPPTGKFLLPEDPTKDVIMMAGGSGVTPFRAFVREITRRGLPTRAAILYSVRVPQDIIFNDEFRKLEASNPNFRFLVTCTRATPEHGWTGRTGRIDAQWILDNTRDLNRTVYYTCATNELLDSMVALLTAAGVPKDHIVFEKWG